MLSRKYIIRAAEVNAMYLNVKSSIAVTIDKQILIRKVGAESFVLWEIVIAHMQWPRIK